MFRVITCNLNGIRAATKKGFFAWAYQEQPDIVCLQEVKAQHLDISKHVNLAQLMPGFQSFFQCGQHKGYAGVGILTRHTPQRVIHQLGWESADREGRYLQADFPHCSVISLYLPSGTSSPARQSIKMAFLAKYAEHLLQQLQAGMELIIAGDWNIAHTINDLTNWRTNQDKPGFLPAERAWLDHLINNLGLVDAFRLINQNPDQYTWWSQRHPHTWHNNVGWRLDYQLISRNLRSRVQDARIYKAQRFSDHAPVIIDYNLPSPSHSDYQEHGLSSISDSHKKQQS